VEFDLTIMDRAAVNLSVAVGSGSIEITPPLTIGVSTSDAVHDPHYRRDGVAPKFLHAPPKNVAAFLILLLKSTGVSRGALNKSKHAADQEVAGLVTQSTSAVAHGPRARASRARSKLGLPEEVLRYARDVKTR